jgi:hypothetical protein
VTAAILTAVTMKSAAIWNVTPFSLVKVYQCFVAECSAYRLLIHPCLVLFVLSANADVGGSTFPCDFGELSSHARGVTSQKLVLFKIINYFPLHKRSLARN